MPSSTQHGGGVLFNSTLQSLPRPTSDHVPLLVTASTAAPVSPVFRYEKSWAFDPDFLQLVTGVWNRPQNLRGSPTDRVCRSLKWTRAVCKKWARGRRRPAAILSACRAVLELLDLLEELRPLTLAKGLLRSLVKARLARAVWEQDVYWRQRYSIRTCKLGDENTTFYHASASVRLRANKIQMLHDDDVPVSTHVANECIQHRFYADLLGRTFPVVFLDELGRMLPPVPHLDDLEAPFTSSEVKTALWQMRTASSPGPDGFGPAFFRTFWPVVGDPLLAWLASFHAGTADLSWINLAHVVLLPKKPGVATADGFLPISLQNCVPKLAAKVLTNRLQPFITDLVAPLPVRICEGALHFRQLLAGHGARSMLPRSMGAGGGAQTRLSEGFRLRLLGRP